MVNFFRRSDNFVTVTSNSNVMPLCVGLFFITIVFSVYLGFFGSGLGSGDIFILYMLPWFLLITHASYETDFNSDNGKIILTKRYFLGAKVVTTIDVDDFEGVEVDCSRQNFYGRMRGVNLYLNYIDVKKRNPHRCVPITVNGMVGTHSYDDLESYANKLNALMVGALKEKEVAV